MKPWKATKPNREALSLTYISVPERQSQKCKGHTQKHRTHTPEPPGLGADLTPRAPGRWEGQRATGAYPRGLLLTPSFCLWAAPGLMPTLLAGSAFREWTSPAHLLLCDSWTTGAVTASLPTLPGCLTSQRDPTYHICNFAQILQVWGHRWFLIQEESCGPGCRVALWTKGDNVQSAYCFLLGKKGETESRTSVASSQLAHGHELKAYNYIKSACCLVPPCWKKNKILKVKFPTKF